MLTNPNLPCFLDNPRMAITLYDFGLLKTASAAAGLCLRAWCIWLLAVASSNLENLESLP